jgi:hypothetical protein
MLYDLIWHPSKYRVVNDMCTTCPQCQLSKISSVTIAPPKLKICTSEPFELMAVDLISLPKTANGYIGCLMCVDHYSKWVAAVPIRNKTGLTVSNALKNQVLPFIPRVPVRILSDNGPEFTCSQFRDVLKTMGIVHQFTTPYCPSSNGGIERVNRTVQGLLRSLTDKQSNWDQYLTQAIITYNNTLHSELNLSPSSFLLNKSHCCNSLPLLDVNKIQQYWKTGHNKYSPFEIGQEVLMKIPTKGNLTIDKLSVKYKGPFLVEKVNSNNVTYILTNPKVTNSVIRAHHSDLYPYKTVPFYLRSHPWFERAESEDVPEVVRSGRSPVMCDSDSTESELSTSDYNVSDSSTSHDSDSSSSSDNSLADGSGSDLAADFVLFDCSQCPMCKLESYLELKCQSVVDEPSVQYSEVNSIENISAVGEPLFNVNCETWEMSGGEFSFHSNESTSKSESTTTESHVSQIVPVNNNNELNVTNESITALEGFFDELYDELVASKVDSVQSVQLGRTNEGEGADESVASPVIVNSLGHHTRSRGPVPTLPNVQKRILERMKKYIRLERLQ